MAQAIFSRLPIALISKYISYSKERTLMSITIFTITMKLLIIATKIFYCSMKASDVPKLEVKLGDHNIQSTTDTKTTDVKVANIIKHKGFSQRTLVSKSIQVAIAG